MAWALLVLALMVVAFLTGSIWSHLHDCHLAGDPYREGLEAAFRIHRIAAFTQRQMVDEAGLPPRPDR